MHSCLRCIYTHKNSWKLEQQYHTTPEALGATQCEKLNKTIVSTSGTRYRAGNSCGKHSHSCSSHSLDVAPERKVHLLLKSHSISMVTDHDDIPAGTLKLKTPAVLNLHDPLAASTDARVVSISPQCHGLTRHLRPGRFQLRLAAQPSCHTHQHSLFGWKSRSHPPYTLPIDQIDHHPIFQEHPTGMTKQALRVLHWHMTKQAL